MGLELNPAGKKLLAQYSALLDNFREEIYQSLPSMDPGMVRPFISAYRAEASKKPYRDNNKSYAQAVARCQRLAAPLLDMANGVLSDDKHDAQLVEASVIAEATPLRLASFAQQSKVNERLINQLLSNPSLMKQMQVADGARNGNYGLTMQIYTSILHISKLARKGVFQRLALATALSQKPHLIFKFEPPYNPVQRYLDYQKAYLKGEIDPYFPTFTVWLYRYVIDDPQSDAEIDWIRTALQNYLPSTVFNRNYLDVVHTDVGYSHEHLGIVQGNFISQLIAGGGECGARAWVGRLSERAFGIPVWGVKQRGHAAMSEWTPRGWTTPFGAGYRLEWWDHRRGLDFSLEARARTFPMKYSKVLRAQWIGAAMGESAPNGMVPGTGGFWYALAKCEERAIVTSGQPKPMVPTLKQLMERYGPTLAQKVQMRPISRSALKISTDAGGVIHVPAVACSQPRKNTVGVTFTKSFAGGMQVHYFVSRRPPPPLIYYVHVRHGGKYELIAKIVALRPESKVVALNTRSQMVVVVNHASQSTVIPIQWTNGLWQNTEPDDISLKTGANELLLRPGDNFHAVSIKDFVLKPMP